MSAPDPHRHWNTLTSIATLGTSRTAFVAETLWPDQSVAHPDGSRERTLLRIAAASYVWQLAGERSPAVNMKADSQIAITPREQVEAERTGFDSKPASVTHQVWASEQRAAAEPAATDASRLGPELTGIREHVSGGQLHPAREVAAADESRLEPELTGIGERASRGPLHPVSEAAAWRLARMINGDHRELIPEWFALANRAQAVIPPHWLPVVLDVLDVNQRNAFSNVLGEHAVWLAERNPAWSMRPVAAEPSEERWTSGTTEERRIELTAMRVREPAQARRWLESTWSTDPPDAREDLVRVLLIGLSAEDEPFLESALDDRRKGVRLAAAECLARLPRSAYARRAAERLHSLVVLEPAKTGLLGKLVKRKLHVELPASIDKAATRDGIEVKPPANRKIGERTYWLAQMVSLVRPAHWTERFECTPETFIDAALATEHGPDLLMALSTATVRYPDIEWIKALCERWLARHGKGDNDEAARTIVALLSTAPAAEREGLLQWLLRSLGSAPFGLAYTLLACVDTAWNAETTNLALKLIADASRSDTQQWSHTRTALAEWGRRADVATAAEKLSGILDRCPPDSPWRNALEHLSAIVDFRLAMHKELLT